MNIFYLDEKPQSCAELHCDKHVVKMIIEYAQLLSTCHRVLDGKEYYDKTANGRRIKRWKMDDPRMESSLYKASHVNHPSNIYLDHQFRTINSYYNFITHCVLSTLIVMVRFILHSKNSKTLLLKFLKTFLTKDLHNQLKQCLTIVSQIAV